MLAYDIVSFLSDSFSRSQNRIKFLFSRTFYDSNAIYQLQITLILWKEPCRSAKIHNWQLSDYNKKVRQLNVVLQFYYLNLMWNMQKKKSTIFLPSLRWQYMGVLKYEHWQYMGILKINTAVYGSLKI